VLAPNTGADRNGSLVAGDLPDWEAAREALGARRTLIFLNACDVARQRPSLIGTDGLASGFAELGAAAVVAPLWTVDDEAAHGVAQRFYDLLKSKRPQSLAAILRKIRQMAYDGKGSDTHAAYCLFGDPRAIATIAAKGAQASTGRRSR
jgi:hypothetical protein